MIFYPEMLLKIRLTQNAYLILKYVKIPVRSECL